MARFEFSEVSVYNSTMNPRWFIHPARIFILSFLFLVFSRAPLSAQMTDRYIAQAVFQVSADQTADFWLNGHHLFTQPYTGLQGGPQTRICLPDHLCYFQRDNTLAIRVENFNHSAIGVAYLLRLILSDGSNQIFTSAETDQHKALYLTGDLEPYGWQQPGFDDKGWGKAFDAGPVPYAAILPDPDGDQVSFLSALGASSQVRQAGERHLFRIQFDLDVLPNPRCAAKGPLPTPTPLSFPQAGDSSQPSLAAPLPTATPESLSLPPGRAPMNQAHVLDSWDGSESPEVNMAPAMIPAPAPVWTATPQPPPQNVQQPLSFYVSLQDGAGLYQLDVVDSSGRVLQTLIRKSLTGPEQVWVQWDGKDAQGRNLPLGNYSLLCSKDGQVLRTMNLPEN